MYTPDSTNGSSPIPAETGKAPLLSNASTRIESSGKLPSPGLKQPAEPSPNPAEEIKRFRQLSSDEQPAVEESFEQLEGAAEKAAKAFHLFDDKNKGFLTAAELSLAIR